MQIKELQYINQDKLLQDYYQIEKYIEWFNDDKTKQCALQHTKENISFLEGCGRLNTAKFKETDFNVCHSIINDTIFKDIIKEFNLYRTRLMWMKPKVCYSLHIDPNPRIHIPIITNPWAMFVFADSGLHHLPIGKVYWVNTKLTHSFANFGDTDRLHLIGCL